MEYELEQLLAALSSLDISLINGMYHIHIFENSGRCTVYKDKDLVKLIHDVHEDIC
jgi:hypothetical protein